jgi:hypothetical protein
MITLPAEKLIAAPQPNALKPMNNGSTVDTKFSPKDRVKLFLNSC